MKHIIRSVVASGGLLAAFNIGVPSVLADQQVNQAFSQDVHATVNIDETGCLNHPGPTITISGSVKLGGLGIRLILANNVKGTHQVEVTGTVDLTLIPLGKQLSIPKQPVLGGVGGNPYLYVQFYNKKGNLGDEVFIGRCVQGLKLGHDSINDSLAAVIVSALGCNNSPGPNITFGGGAKMSGLHAKIIFRNNVKGTHTAESSASVDIIPEGTDLVIPKSPAQGGAGGNPLIWVQLLHGNGNTASDPIFLGRCNKI